MALPTNEKTAVKGLSVASTMEQSMRRCTAKTSFTRCFYQPQSMRTLEEVCAEVLALEQEAEGC